MKKEFLDCIYELRYKVILEINRLVQITKQDKCAPCEKCNSDCDETTMAELRTRRSQLSSIDDTIKDYLRIHSNIE